MWPEYFISIICSTNTLKDTHFIILHYHTGLGCWHMGPNESVLQFLGSFSRMQLKVGLRTNTILANEAEEHSKTDLQC